MIFLDFLLHHHPLKLSFKLFLAFQKALIILRFSLNPDKTSQASTYESNWCSRTSSLGGDVRFYIMNGLLFLIFQVVID